MSLPLSSSLNTNVVFLEDFEELKKIKTEISEYLEKQELDKQVKDYISSLKNLIKDFIAVSSNLSMEEFERKFSDFTKMSPSSMPPEVYKECQKAVVILEKALTP